MKRTVLFMGILLAASSTYAQDIFKKHGHDKEMLTLSKGRYKETFINEEVMQIGTVLINTRTDKVIKFIEEATTGLGYKAEATSRFLTIDPLAEKFPWQSPYVFCNNNPIRYIDPTGEAAWDVTRDWNEQDLENFQQFVADRLKQYVDNNKKANCASLAFDLIIDYASENGLQLTLQTKDGRSFDSNADVYNTVDDFKYGAKGDNGQRDKSTSVFTQMFARDVSSNTTTVDKANTVAGDMAILTAPADHIVIFNQGGATAQDRRVSYGNLMFENGVAKNTTITYNKRDWTNSTVDGQGRTMVYNPGTSKVHRWKVFTTTGN
ncbi:MAG: hypothetical protein LBI82_04600 [Dysgonamonadaceae bacterium]|jgi:hypothetical protein|nr:hypothetical protein [Dysgonamonadaceae bacterium]